VSLRKAAAATGLGDLILHHDAEAAIDGEAGGVDVTGTVAGQEKDGVSDVVGRSDPLAGGQRLPALFNLGVPSCWCFRLLSDLNPTKIV